MSSPTVEQRIIQEYQKPVPDLLESYASKGMTSKQVAQILDCGALRLDENQAVKEIETLKKKLITLKKIVEVHYQCTFLILWGLTQPSMRLPCKRRIREERIRSQ